MSKRSYYLFIVENMPTGLIWVYGFNIKKMQHDNMQINKTLANLSVCKMCAANTHKTTNQRNAAGCTDVDVPENGSSPTICVCKNYISQLLLSGAEL